jgi:hypothetical protein
MAVRGLLINSVRLSNFAYSNEFEVVSECMPRFYENFVVVGCWFVYLRYHRARPKIHSFEIKYGW